MHDPLDNPVWSSLTGPHAGLAIGTGAARHNPRDMAPFSAIAGARPAAYADLARDLPSGLEARLFRPKEEASPAGWRMISARPILHMAAGAPPAPDEGEAPEKLDGSDIDAMRALAAAAKPGPFDRRTPALGRYLGLRENGRLTRALMRGIADRGEIAFLHVFPDNPVASLYERLGFKWHRTLLVLWHRPA